MMIITLRIASSCACSALLTVSADVSIKYFFTYIISYYLSSEKRIKDYA